MRSNTVRRYGMLVLLGSIVPFALAANADTAAAKQERGGSGLVAGNERIEAAFTRRDNALLAQGIVNLGTKFNWVAPDTAAGPHVLQGESLTTGFGGQGGFQFSKQSQQSTAQGGTESLVQGAGANGLALDWWVRSFPRVSVVEYQARLRNTGAAVIPKLKEFGPLTLRLRGDQGQLKVHWVRRDAYQKQEATLKDSLTVDGGSWNAPESAGWVMIENVDKKEILFLGVEWESYWRVTLRRQGAEVALECTLDRFVRDSAPGAEMMSPRVFSWRLSRKCRRRGAGLARLSPAVRHPAVAAQLPLGHVRHLGHCGRRQRRESDLGRNSLCGLARRGTLLRGRRMVRRLLQGQGTG